MSRHRDLSTFTIGIDVGGTHVRASTVDSSGCIFSTRRAPTPRSVDGFQDWIVEAMQQIQADNAKGSAGAIGLALPGVVDAEHGVVMRSVNLPFLEGRPVSDDLSKRTGVAVKLMTDADAATWGEYTVCTPRPRAFVHLRLGTGVACGIVVDNRLQPTDPARKTHWKVLVVDHRPEAIACSCGLRGCLETIASGPALERQAAAMGFGGLDGLQKAWERDGFGAHAIVDFAASATASAISNLKSQIQKHPLPAGRGSESSASLEIVFCLGGGVIAALPCLLARVIELAQAADTDARTLVVPAALGDDAGVIGAAMLAHA